MDTHIYCRLCLAENVRLKHSLFENDLLNILMDIASIKICDGCFKTIKNLKKFRDRCNDSEKFLEQKYNLIGIDENEVHIKSDPEEEITQSDNNHFLDIKSEDENLRMIIKKRKKLNKLRQIKKEKIYKKSKLKENKQIQFDKYANNIKDEKLEEITTVHHEILSNNISNSEIKTDNHINLNETDLNNSNNDQYESDYSLPDYEPPEPPKVIEVRKSKAGRKRKYFENEEYICKYCNQNYKTPKELRIHNVSKKHKKAVLKYQEKFKDTINLVDEIKIDDLGYFKKDQEGKYYCEFCEDVKFNYIKSMHRHYISMHVEDLNLKDGKPKNGKLEDGTEYCYFCKDSFRMKFLKHVQTRPHRIKAGVIKGIKLPGTKDEFLDEISKDLQRDELGQYYCDPCYLVFINIRNMLYHLESPLHKELAAFQNDLKDDLKKMIEQNKQKDLNLNKTDFYCDKCEIYFKNEVELKNHFENLNHDLNFIPKLKCMYCNDGIKNITDHLYTQQHKESMRKYNALVRRSTYQLIAKMKKSIQVKTEEIVGDEEEQIIPLKDGKLPEHHCIECNFTYFSKQQLSAHLLTHTNDQYKIIKETEKYFRFKCKYCARRFNVRSILRKHENGHEGIPTVTKKNICYICGTEILDINYHLSSVHGVNNSIKYTCQLCKEQKPKFDTRILLTEHLKKMHNTTVNTARVICPTCGASVYRSHLNTHIKRKHLGIRPYQCEVCQKTFPWRSGYKEHLKIHKNERPFSCEICFKAFHTKRTLKRHFVVHTGERVKCDMCDKTFTQKSQIGQHKKRDHPELFSVGNDTYKNIGNAWFPYR